MARTLESTLEAKLAAVRAAENNLAAQRARRPVALTEQELAWITTAGADVRAVFEAPTTTLRERKQLIRAVIDEIAITVRAEERVAQAADPLAGRRRHRGLDADDQARPASTGD